jgi:putative intracellular protease/amidase
MSAPTKIVIPVYNGMTHLDFTGPHQFLSRVPEFEVVAASMTGEPVRSDGLVFAELANLSQIDRCDVICVPGGAGVTAAVGDHAFVETVRRLAQTATYVTSVCNGSLILGAAGLLKNKLAACHWAWREFLPIFGAIPDPGRVVRDGHTITGGGVTAGIDFALVLIAELVGEERAQTIQLALEYAPEPPYDAGRPEVAPASIYETLRARYAVGKPGQRKILEAAAANI